MLKQRWDNLDGFWNKIETSLSNSCNKVEQGCINVVSASKNDVVSTLCFTVIPTSDYVVFSTSDQRYSNVSTLNCNAKTTLIQC